MKKKFCILLLVAIAMASCHFRPKADDKQTDGLGFGVKAEVDSVMLDSIKVSILAGEFDGRGMQQDSLLYFMNSMNTWQALPEAMPYYAILADGGTPAVCGWIYDAMKQDGRLQNADCRAFAQTYLEKGVELGNSRCADRLAELLKLGGEAQKGVVAK